MKIVRRRAGRPYPKDTERKLLVMTELIKRSMTITDLAREIGMSLSYVSELISGSRRSAKNEARIAFFFNKKPKELFPVRSRLDIAEMRKKSGRGQGRGVA